MYDKKVNVLFIITKLELGGAQKVCLSLLDGVKKNGGFAGLISGADGPLVSEVKNLDSVYLLPEFKREVGLKNIFKDIYLFFKLIKLIKKNRKNYTDLIVHTHSTKAGILGRWAAFFAGIKNIVHTVHGFGFHENQNKIYWISIYLAEFFTAFITTKFVCVSNYDLKFGSKYLPFFKKKALIIRAAVDYDKFYIPAKCVKNIESDNFVIGTVSCFKPQKNLIDLLRAFKRLLKDLSEKKDKIFLEIVGDGVLRPELENFINQNDLKNNVKLLGWQSNVASIVKTWDLFVMSSLWEGLPCAIIEARLSKLPVISYNISGIPEVIFDNKNGFLVESQNWQLLSEKIKFYINNNSEYLSAANYKDNLSGFHKNYMIEKHIDLYRDFSQL
ncbi:glycosyltransferase [Candidatus Dependentiae bacterium]|nr:glycosyltransferase [Candidatus Dependentiae bacterium]